MADENTPTPTAAANENEEAGSADSALDELDLAGRGYEGLNDGEESDILGGGGSNAGSIGEDDDDATNLANIQSAPRDTYESIVSNQVPEGEALHEQRDIVIDPFRVSDPDGNVSSRFDSEPQPRPDEAPIADDDEEAAPPQAAVEEEPEEPVEEERDPEPGFDFDDGDDAAAPQAAQPVETDSPPDEEPEDDDPDEEDPKTAQDPSLSLQPASGIEDNLVKLDLVASGNDSDGGSETVEVIITNVPEGFNFVDSNGDPLGNGAGGTFTFGPTELADLYLKAPEHYSGDVPLTVTATATEANGDQSSVTQIMDVRILAVADTPDLAATASGTEDTWFALDVDAALVDQDGSEVLSLTISDIPDGVQMRSGGTAITIENGVAQVTADQITGLELLAPLHSDETFEIKVTATATEDVPDELIHTETASRSVTVNVPVVAVADAPTLAVEDSAGMENTWIDVNITSELVDNDGSEDLSVYITGVPDGASLNSGVKLTEAVVLEDGSTFQAGTWVVSPGDLDTLQIKQAENVSDDMALQVYSATTEDQNGDVAVTGPLDIRVDVGIVDPSVSGSGVGDEDTWIDLNLSAQVNAADGTETMVVYLENLPDGVSIRYADTGQALTETGGRYIVTDDLDNLQVKWTADHPDADFSFQLRAVVEDVDMGSNTETASGDALFGVAPDQSEAVTTVDVTVNAVADAPTLSAEDSAGMENTAIALDITSNLVDADGSESMKLYITGVPDGASLNNGTELTAATVVDGVTYPAGTYVLDPADLTGLTITPPTNVSDDFNLEVSSVTTEVRGGDQATTGPETIRVDVGVVDPTLTGSGAGNEDTWIDLDVSASVNAADGTETLTVTLEDLPSGVQLQDTSTGTILTPTNGVYDITGKLDSLQVRWDPSSDEHSDADITFNLRALVEDMDVGTATETAITDTVAPDSSETVTPVTVTVRAVADAPELSGSAVGVEDKWFDFNISNSLVDTDGSESLSSVTMTGIPDGVSLRSGGDAITITGGEATITQAQLADLEMLAPTDSNVDFNVSIAVTSTESATGDQLAVLNATTTKTVAVKVFGDADTPTVQVDEVPKNIDEDTFYSLRTAIGERGFDFAVDGDLTEQNSADSATSGDGSESLTFRITPQESGTRLAISDDATIESGELVDLPAEGYWTVSAADVFAGKVFVGGAENWASSGATDYIHFDIQTVATENDADADDSALNGTGLTREGTATSDAQTLTLFIDPVADRTILTANDSGNEDQSGGIAVAPEFQLVDTDGSETLVGNVVITSTDPEFVNGATFSLDGTQLTPTENSGTYTWSIPVSELTDQGGGNFTLENFIFNPVEHSSGDVNYTIKVTTQDGNGDQFDTTADGYIEVKADADGMTLDVGEAVDRTGENGLVTGTEDTYINLGLDAQFIDTDGSESIRFIRLRDVPDDWTVGYLDNGSFTQASKSGSNWNLDYSKLDQVVLNPKDDLHLEEADAETIRLWVRVRDDDAKVTGEETGKEYDREQDTNLYFDVKIIADADAPSAIVTNARGTEDTKIALDINPSLADTDGSESLTVFLSDVPDGSSFFDGSGDGAASAGTRGNIVDGAFVADAAGTHWMFTTTELDGLHILPPVDSNEDFQMTVTTRSTEASNGDYEEVSTTLDVTLIGDADEPLIPDALQNELGQLVAQGHEDTEIDPGFGQYGTTDTDTDAGRTASESLSVVLKNIPTGLSVYMTAGNEEFMKYIGGGKWSIDPEYLGEVRMMPQKDFAGTYEVELDLIVTENDGDVTSVSKTLVVEVEAEADKPSVSLSGNTTEDQWGAGVDLTITARPTDTTNGVEEITEITITLPDTVDAGIRLTLGGTEYSPGDTITLTGNDLATYYDAATDQLTGLTMTGFPEHSSLDVPLTITATATDADGSTSTTTSNTNVDIKADADAPQLSVDANPATADHTQTIDFNLNAAVTDTDGTESMYFIVDDVPNGMTLTAGFNIGDGQWLVPHTDAMSLGATSNGGTGTATLKLHAAVIDDDPDAGDPTDRYFDGTGLDINLQFTDVGGTGGTGGYTGDPADVASPPTIDITPGTTPEDTSIDLDGIVSVTPADGSGDTISAIVISDLPDGVGISGGNIWLNPLNNTYVVQGDSLAGISISPKTDFSGDITFDIKAIATDNGAYAETSLNDTVVINVTPVTDGVGFGVSLGDGADTVEDPDNPIPLDVTLSQLDDDFSESIVDNEITVSGLPDGAVLYYNGSPATMVGDTATFTISDITGVGSVDLSGLAIMPPAHFHGSMSLTFGATVQDQTGASKAVTSDYTLNVTAEADTPQLTANNVTGSEDGYITLDLDAISPDLKSQGGHGSEFLSVVIGSDTNPVPDGAVLTGAFNNKDGTWTVKAANVNEATGEISGVSILLPEHYSGTVTLDVQAYTVEPSNGDIASSTQTFTVTADGVADTPEIDPANATGAEDSQIALNLNAQLVDSSEIISAYINNVPDGASFTDGSGTQIGTRVQVDNDGKPVVDGSGNPVAAGDNDVSSLWFFTAAQIGVLHFVGSAHASGTFTMEAFARAADGSSTADSTLVSFEVEVTGVADTPTLTITDLTPTDALTEASGAEDQSGGIAIDIAMSSPDTDGSEAQQVLITGAPAGSTFVTTGGATISDTNGTWSISSDNLAGLKLVTPEDYNGSFTLNVTAQTSEDSTTATDIGTLRVDVTAVNDAADVVANGGAGQSISTLASEAIRVIPDATGDGSSISFSDVDGSQLSGLTVQITSGGLTGDTLGLKGYDISQNDSGDLVVDGTGITVGYDADNFLLTFSGDGSYDTYSQLAESVILTSPDGELSAGVRNFQISALDEEGAVGSLSTNANLVDATDGLISLDTAALGDVTWATDGTLLGGAGDDQFVYEYGTGNGSLDGGTGTDELFIRESDGSDGGWTLQAIDTDTYQATSTANPDHSWTVQIDNGAQMDAGASDDKTLVFDGEASGTITFEDGSQLAFEELDKIGF